MWKLWSTMEHWYMWNVYNSKLKQHIYLCSILKFKPLTYHLASLQKNTSFDVCDKDEKRYIWSWMILPFVTLSLCQWPKPSLWEQVDHKRESILEMERTFFPFNTLYLLIAWFSWEATYPNWIPHVNVLVFPRWTQ